jgi:hypothetical protein
VRRSSWWGRLRNFTFPFETSNGKEAGREEEEEKKKSDFGEGWHMDDSCGEKEGEV